jgi:hypothetical protein
MFLNRGKEPKKNKTKATHNNTRTQERLVFWVTILSTKLIGFLVVGEMEPVHGKVRLCKMPRHI